MKHQILIEIKELLDKYQDNIIVKEFVNAEDKDLKDNGLLVKKVYDLFYQYYR